MTSFQFTATAQDTATGKTASASSSFVIQSAASFTPGATIGKNNYPGTTEAQAISTFDGFVSRPMAASAAKIYQQPDGVYGPVTQDWKDIINADARLLINLHPSIPNIQAGGSTAAAENAAIVAFLNQFVSLGASFDISIWAEANDPGSAWGSNPAGFKAFFQAIAPNLKSKFNSLGCNVAWNAASFGQSSGKGLWADYYPGDAYVDMALLDYYSPSFVNDGLLLDGMAAIADNHAPNPIPLGLGEWNVGQLQTITVAQWNSYWQYIRSFFLTRKNARKVIGPIIFFMGNPDVGRPTSQVLSSSDFKIPALQSIYDTFS